MPYWRIYFHLVWATQDREPLIDDAIAAAIGASIRSTCQVPGVVLHGVGVMPDHVHVAPSLPPRLAFAAFVGKLKGGSSYAVNTADQRPRSGPLAWQSEYGALSFGERAPPKVLDYLRNQRDHHAANRVWSTLERTTDPTA